MNKLEVLYQGIEKGNERSLSFDTMDNNNDLDLYLFIFSLSASGLMCANWGFCCIIDIIWLNCWFISSRIAFISCSCFCCMAWVSFTFSSWIFSEKLPAIIGWKLKQTITVIEIKKMILLSIFFILSITSTIIYQLIL